MPCLRSLTVIFHGIQKGTGDDAYEGEFGFFALKLL